MVCSYRMMASPMDMLGLAVAVTVAYSEPMKGNQAPIGAHAMLVLGHIKAPSNSVYALIASSASATYLLTSQSIQQGPGCQHVC